MLKERGYARWTGIITPYKMQKEMLRKEFTKRQFDRFQIDTVDAYQGKEKGITILSCVRANSTQGNIGFLINPQRMNVALTRAIESLVILAHCQSLQVRLSMHGKYRKNISVTVFLTKHFQWYIFYKVLSGGHSLWSLAPSNKYVFIELAPFKDFCNDASLVATVFKRKKALCAFQMDKLE